MDLNNKRLESAHIPVKLSLRRIWQSIFLGVGVVLVALIGYLAYVYQASPVVIRKPLLEHYHYRMQIIVNGKAEDFSSKAYQQDYAKGQCTGLLPEQPIHFHDGKDQITHIHWEGMTGGLVMKYYGWNYIGGLNDALGYNLNDAIHPKKVPIHGKVLPAVPAGTQFYVYSGDEHNHKQRSFEDWTKQDLEVFFGTTSNFPAHKLNKQKTGSLDRLFPKVYAHGDVINTPSASPDETVEEKRTRINNLIGNVVIFAQKNTPTDKQVTDSFNHLQPLTDSTCGG